MRAFLAISGSPHPGADTGSLLARRLARIRIEFD